LRKRRSGEGVVSTPRTGIRTIVISIDIGATITTGTVRLQTHLSSHDVQYFADSIKMAPGRIWTELCGSGGHDAETTNTCIVMDEGGLGVGIGGLYA
jgi:hypothetical protein